MGCSGGGGRWCLEHQGSDICLRDYRFVLRCCRFRCRWDLGGWCITRAGWYPICRECRDC
ncbi:hypothetical protein yruck0001_7870 [Yersinia ruckeri ATCC 29473]|nr:hypothetical protein yruck0001_7870 [Yersinia ruckeri ATCC 29473]